MLLLSLLPGLLAFCTCVARAQSRTAPPAGATVVRRSGTQVGEFSTISAAAASLPNDGSARVIFIYPGTYTEQVHLTRNGKLTIMGYTTNTMSFADNQVSLTSVEGTISATLRIDQNNVAVYNIDVVNNFGPHTASGAQALAVAGYGTNLGFYAVRLFGYQDTLRAEKGVQFYGLCYIEGAVDFIFGQNGHAFFHRNTIASVDAGAITADGPDTTTESLFVINESTITQSTAATRSLTGLVFLGRPWSAQAQVAYISCNLGAVINSAGWEIWSTATPNTANVLFAEFNSTGVGATGTRASFSTKLPSAAGFGIADVLGANWTSWVDATYFT
ncbi:carbohydrate esterase family 8 protein [Mycena pura]|uniref:Pectinesterase n=1 Tax=Mycena pura TaxID=153505 RepID=A0AAD6Y2P8_9AGAR|nr:carbohydrate esterase family 8 protein [Mycena pura]